MRTRLSRQFLEVASSYSQYTSEQAERKREQMLAINPVNRCDDCDGTQDCGDRICINAVDHVRAKSIVRRRAGIVDRRIRPQNSQHLWSAETKAICTLVSLWRRL